MNQPDDLTPDSAKGGDAPESLTNASAQQPKAKPTLPFSKLMPMLCGAVLGIVFRLIFSGKPDSVLEPMGSAFILIIPLVVGAVTVYIAETKERRSWRYYIAAGMLANVMFVLGTMVILIEGLICVIIIAPLFAVIGAIGAVMMGAICRFTNWPKATTYCFAGLPLFVALSFPAVPENVFIGEVTRTIQVNSSADAIWQQLLTVKNIRPDEVGDAWMYRIGVPMPIAGVTEQTSAGLVRHVTMGKSIHFDQFSTDWREDQFVRWQYRFSADSFPPNALDDHVRIGGKYFDLIDTEYSIAPINSNHSELQIRMHYRVSTQFNWYANGVAQLLMGNFEEVILKFYRERSEKT
jgi:hypothetical protein